MKTSFLEYYKMIQDKVSFDDYLFSKEYRKALSKLQSKEIHTLNKWLRSKGYYPRVMNTAPPHANLLLN